MQVQGAGQGTWIRGHSAGWLPACSGKQFSGTTRSLAFFATFERWDLTASNDLGKAV